MPSPIWPRFAAVLFLSLALGATLALWPLRASALTLTLDTVIDARPLGAGAAERLSATATFGPAFPSGARLVEGFSATFLGGTTTGRYEGLISPIDTRFARGILFNATSDEAPFIGGAPGTGPHGCYRLRALTLWLPGIVTPASVEAAEGRLILDLLDTEGEIVRLFGALAPGSIARGPREPVAPPPIAAPPVVPLPAPAALLLTGLGLLALRAKRSRSRAPSPSAPSPGPSH